MITRVLAFSLLGAICCVSAHAVPGGTEMKLSRRADINAHEISNAQALLDEIEQTMSQVRRGKYGEFGQDELDRMVAAQATIATLLDGLSHARQLKAPERIELYNAQERFASIMRDDEENRVICTPVKGSSSRLAKADCISTAGHKARAKSNRWEAINLQMAPANKLGVSPQTADF